MDKSVAVVIPTIREDCIKRFLKEWDNQLSSYTVIVVEDNPKRSFDLTDYSYVNHYAWNDIDAVLGDNAWIIPRRTDCVRSFGFYMAQRNKDCDTIITLDDDCYPIDGGFIEGHKSKLHSNCDDAAWVLSCVGATTRGVPYRSLSRARSCVINHGLWVGVPDYDAVTQLSMNRHKVEFEPVNQVIPVGSYFPMCGMNLAFKRIATPAMYFLLMGKDYPFDRFGDIWAGIIIKKICDHLGYAVKSGDPAVEHTRASNLWANLRKEAPGMEVNEWLWIEIDRMVLTGTTFGQCYKEIANGLIGLGDYWRKLANAMHIWVELLE